MGALGAVPPPDPWCWDVSGFKACHDRNWKACDAKRNDDKLFNKKVWTAQQFDDCVFSADIDKCDCPALDPNRNKTTTSTTSSGFTWKNTTANPAVKTMQIDINKVLTKNGYASIGTDGKLGPGTCGGARVADRHGGNFVSKYGLASICQSYTEPQKLMTAPSSSSTATLEPVAPASSSLISGVSNQNLLLIGLAAAAAAYYFATQSKPQRA